MNNQEIRFNILKLLYERKKEHPGRGVSSENLLNELSIKKEELDFNIDYLEEKYWVRLIKFLGGNFIADITAEGIDLVENEPSLRREFPSVQFIIQNGQVNIANQNSDGNISNVSITNEEILKRVDELDNATEIKPYVEAILAEEKKQEEKRDSNIIKKSWMFIRKNAPTIVPLIKPIIERLFGFE